MLMFGLCSSAIFSASARVSLVPAGDGVGAAGAERAFGCEPAGAGATCASSSAGIVGFGASGSAFATGCCPMHVEETRRTQGRSFLKRGLLQPMQACSFRGGHELLNIRRARETW